MLFKQNTINEACVPIWYLEGTRRGNNSMGQSRHSFKNTQKVERRRGKVKKIR
jgi:hypothetical protein